MNITVLTENDLRKSHKLWSQTPLVFTSKYTLFCPPQAVFKASGGSIFAATPIWATQGSKCPQKQKVFYELWSPGEERFIRKGLGCSLPQGRVVGQGFGAGIWGRLKTCGLHSPSAPDLQRSWCDLCAWFGGTLLCFSPPFEMLKSGEAQPLPRSPPQLFPTNSYAAFSCISCCKRLLQGHRAEIWEAESSENPPPNSSFSQSSLLGRVSWLDTFPAVQNWCQHTQVVTCRGLAAASPEHRRCLQYLT